MRKNERIGKVWCLLLVCFLAAVFWPARAGAAELVASGTCGVEDDGSNVTWALDDEGTLTISGTGAMADYTRWSYYGYFDSPWYNNREDITAVVIDSGVTQIGYAAFYYCYNLTSVTIPDGVTVIRDNAFYGCYDLTGVTIPDGVTEIGYNAFSRVLSRW